MTRPSSSNWDALLERLGGAVRNRGRSGKVQNMQEVIAARVEKLQSQGLLR